MHVHLRKLAREQCDLVAVWQLAALGWTAHAISHAARDWRRIHSGVYALSQAPLTREQRWMAGTLTAPQTYLSGDSAAACYEMARSDGRIVSVTRHGDGGLRRHGWVHVRHSTALDGNVGTKDSIPITSPERTLIDLSARADPARPFRESLRLKLTTHYLLAVSLEKHRGRRGTKRLAELNDRYSGLPYSRCRSNAEAKGLEILHDAGVPLPAVNKRQAGEEADFTYRDRMLIIEIDGPQFHQISAEDARKQAIWEAVGYTVRRISSDDVYAAPHHLLALLD